MEQLPGRVFHAVPGFEDHLTRELGSVNEAWGQLFYTTSTEVVYWHQNTWLNPLIIEFDSISEAATSLRAMGRNWAPCLFTQFRRASLIASKLPRLPKKRHVFPWLLPDTPMGAWTLLDAHTLAASPICSCPFPGGSIEFEENKSEPPSRAYLKLWEALVLCRKWPQAGDVCLDAGASPGGWTWALSNLGANIIAVDRSPLEPKIAGLEAVRFIKHDAFTLKPEDIGKIDWLFCDVICYPPRLFEWIEKWLASGLCHNFICTIKMQGAAEKESRFEADFETPKRFAQIPGSKVIHLWHNKHELTWMKMKGS
jgi:23S rRNA (cytidine2498-2'-O)-methyltransferase